MYYVAVSLRWLKDNLFSNAVNTLTTLSLTAFLLWSLPPLIDWMIINASFVGSSNNDCNNEGACWIFIREFFPRLMFGSYPESERWRIYSTGIIAILFIFTARQYHRTAFSVILFGLFSIIAVTLLYGGFLGLSRVDTHQWGGLFLTIVIATVGIVGAFPLGILLALGRQSHLPVIRSFCHVFIELWRGVPLITVLFMASVMLPLFLPDNIDINKLLRALLCIMLFASAYLAEVIRGGLQSLPSGQQEAASALGLTYWQQMRYIILPQALQRVIPGIVNTFIGLFKDTTLVLIIGLFDFLGIVQSAATNPEWLGRANEGYAFAALIFWIFCFSMSRYSLHLERKQDQ